MKKLLLPIALISLASCKPSEEKTCQCFKQAANDYMLQGIKPSLMNLAATCKVSNDDYDSHDKALLTACAMEVMESANQKKLIPIDGKPLPDFPTYTFNTLDEFNTSLTTGLNNEYKYFKTLITIQEAYSDYIPLYSGEDANLNALNNSGSYSIPLTGKPSDIDTSKFTHKTGIEPNLDHTIAWDYEKQEVIRDENDYILWVLQDADKNNPHDFLINDLGCSVNYYPKLIGTTLSTSEKFMVIIIERLLAEDKYKNLVSDLKNGRYKLVYVDNLALSRKTKFSFSGIYNGLNSLENYNSTVNAHGMIDVKLFNIHSAELPSALTSKGDPVDISKYLLSNIPNATAN